MSMLQNHSGRKKVFLSQGEVNQPQICPWILFWRLLGKSKQEREGEPRQFPVWKKWKWNTPVRKKVGRAARLTRITEEVPLGPIVALVALTLTLQQEPTLKLTLTLKLALTLALPLVFIWSPLRFTRKRTFGWSCYQRVLVGCRCNFYPTQVYLGSDLWVLSVWNRPCWNLYKLFKLYKFPSYTSHTSYRL